MTRFLFSLSALLALAGAAQAFTAPMPTKAQKATIRAEIRRDAQSQAFYKGLKGRSPSVSVSFHYGQTPKGFIGSGLPVATAVVSAKGRMFPITIGGRIGQEKRDYTILGGTAKAQGAWEPLRQLFRTAGN